MKNEYFLREESRGRQKQKNKQVTERLQLNDTLSIF